MIFQHTYKLVLAGKKTQTRRLNRPRMTIGKSYAVQPGRNKKSVARIIVTGIHQQRLGDITPAAARAEGHGSREEFFESWKKIHGSLDPHEDVWVIQFRLAAPSRGSRR